MTRKRFRLVDIDEIKKIKADAAINSDTVNGFTIESDVPANAQFGSGEGVSDSEVKYWDHAAINQINPDNIKVETLLFLANVLLSKF